MNLFRQAKQLLDTKAGPEMTEAEVQLIATAIIPLMIKADGLFGDITIGEGLEGLAKIVEEANMEVYIGTDKGRWPKGTRVKKVCSEPGDAHPDGAPGTIVGAWGPLTPGQRAEVIIELAKKGISDDIECIYWLVWDDMPGIPVAIADYRIEPIEELRR